MLINAYRYIKRFFLEIRERNHRIRIKTESVINEYENLIQEYNLIRLGQSKLSSRKRKIVKARIFYLISKGHIKATI